MHFSTTSALFLTLGVVSAFPRQRQRDAPCYEDNTLRALERYASEASSFCPKYLASAGVAVPSDFVQYQGSGLTSACSCYEKTAGTVAPTSLTTTATIQPTKSTSVVLSTSTPSTTAVVATSSPAVVPTSTKPSTASLSSATETTASTSASAVATDVTTGGTAKRGLVYDYNSKSAYANFFVGSEYVSFGSNWGDERVTGNGVTIPNSFAFVPTLTVDGNLENSEWTASATAAIQSGSKYLFA